MCSKFSMIPLKLPKKQFADGLERSEKPEATMRTSRRYLCIIYGSISFAILHYILDKITKI